MTSKTSSTPAPFNPMSMWAQKPSIMKPVTVAATPTVSGPNPSSMWNQKPTPVTAAVAKESDPVPLAVEVAPEAPITVDPIIQPSIAVELVSESVAAVTVEAIPMREMSEHEAKIRRRGPPAIPTFTTTPAALSFQPTKRNLSSLRR